jgi:hypothetical protein
MIKKRSLLKELDNIVSSKSDVFHGEEEFNTKTFELFYYILYVALWDVRKQFNFSDNFTVEVKETKREDGFLEAQIKLDENPFIYSFPIDKEINRV